MKTEKISIGTPMGELCAFINKEDADFPGIYVSIKEKDGSEKILTLVEYQPGTESVSSYLPDKPEEMARERAEVPAYCRKGADEVRPGLVTRAWPDPWNNEELQNRTFHFESCGLDVPFAEFLQMLNLLKETYYLCRLVCSDWSLTKDLACVDDTDRDALTNSASQVCSELTNLGSMNANQVMQLIASNRLKDADGVSLFHELELNTKSTLGAVFKALQDEASARDDSFYHMMGAGEFWNEVENPAFIETLFNSAGEIMAETIDGLIGTEMSDDVLHDDVYGVSFYDVGDLMLVFDSQRAAEHFMTRHGVGAEPCELRTYKDGAWFC